ncbi:MAG: 16S rRNA (cytosine(967)-C(5))-methyltransferase RsmB [Clostridia bacterium]|nr:16S rRNA (cytosine(967)-C(5))-methyltransferase RsmB [Clostridia bacterium]
MKNPREVALKGLINLRRNGTWPDLFLKQESADMSPEDGRLCASVLYGTLENINLIDFYISSFSSIKLKKIMPQALDVLRMTVYQLVWMDKIPDSAAINEGVKLAKKYASSASGFVNAVSRALARSKDNLPQVPDKDFAEYLCIKYSHPLWFIKEMIEQIGEAETENLLIENNKTPKTTARVNTLKSSLDDALAKLEKEGVIDVKTTELSGAILFENSFNPVKSKTFTDGLIYVQDIASQLAVTALEPKKGDTVIDMCASPGGKSLMAAQLMENNGKITSCDIHEHKIALLNENAKKYGATIMSAQLNDGTVFNESFADTADKIICDVPCSGMGIIRKKPDIRFKKEEDAKELPPIQLAILKNASRYVKAGGTILYSTCTVRREENEDVVKCFLESNDSFELVPFSLPFGIEAETGYKTLYPHREGFDGFFIAKLRRKK